MDEETFRAIFSAAYLSLVLVRTYYAIRFRRSLGGALSSIRFRRIIRREGAASLALRLIASPVFVGGAVLYAGYPQTIAAFTIALPEWLRWLGAALAAAGIALLAWSHHELGRQWSPDLVLQKKHALITSGPYRWVRHPMYSSIFLFLAAASLISANAVIAVPNALAIAFLYLRIGNEERMLIEKFGRRYVVYMKRTGCLLPKIS